MCTLLKTWFLKKKNDKDIFFINHSQHTLIVLLKNTVCKIKSLKKILYETNDDEKYNKDPVISYFSGNTFHNLKKVRKFYQLTHRTR